MLISLEMWIFSRHWKRRPLDTGSTSRVHSSRITSLGSATRASPTESLRRSLGLQSPIPMPHKRVILINPSCRRAKRKRMRIHFRHSFTSKHPKTSGISHLKLHLPSQDSTVFAGCFVLRGNWRIRRRKIRFSPDVFVLTRIRFPSKEHPLQSYSKSAGFHLGTKSNIFRMPYRWKHHLRSVTAVEKMEDAPLPPTAYDVKTGGNFLHSVILRRDKFRSTFWGRSFTAHQLFK